MSKDFDEILASGDEAAIEAALAEAELSGDILFGEDEDEALPVEEAEETPVETVEQKPEEKDVAETPKEEAPESSTTEEEVKQPGVMELNGKLYAEISPDNAVIESKNGKHHVPYDVLVNARKESADTKAQLDELTKANAELKASFEETKRVSELYSKQLGDAGLDPKLLPEQMLKDPELMAQVKEDYPQIGELVEALARQVQNHPAQQAAQPAQASEVNPLQTALAETKHLNKWRESDADRWDFAKQVDGKLAEDPLYENKPLSERLAEVERRTMAAFGDEAEQVQEKAPPAKPPVQAEKAPIPITPTDVGVQGNDGNAHAHILDQDAASMTAQMQGMSNAQIEALLADASDFL